MSQYEIKFNKRNGWSYEEGEIPVETLSYDYFSPIWYLFCVCFCNIPIC